jgi:hypothetical protein
VIQTAGNIISPNGSTVNNHCNGDNRDYIEMYGSPSGLPGFKFVGESQPSASFGPTYPTYQWECNSGCTDYGVDHLATIGAGRGVHLPYDGNAGSCGTSVVPYSNQDLCASGKWAAMTARTAIIPRAIKRCMPCSRDGKTATGRAVAPRFTTRCIQMSPTRTSLTSLNSNHRNTGAASMPPLVYSVDCPTESAEAFRLSLIYHKGKCPLIPSG